MSAAREVRLSPLALTVLSVIRAAVEDAIPPEAVVVTVRAPNDAETRHFGAGGCVLELRSAHQSEGTAELKVLIGEADRWSDGEWLDVALNDGARGWEIYNDGRVTDSGEPLAFQELRDLVRAVISGQTANHSEAGRSFIPYPASTPYSAPSGDIP